MIYFYYLILAILSLVFTLLGLVLSPILPLLATEQEGWLDNHSKWGVGPRLPNWLSVFMTPDNSLDGDSTFEFLNGISYWSKVKWLCRNPAYSFAIRYIKGDKSLATYKGNPKIKDNDKAVEGWLFVKSQGLFQFTYVKQIGSTATCIYINLGWNIRALVDDNYNPPKDYQATFVFSPRRSGFR